MKAHFGVDDESGLEHSVVGTAANVTDATQIDKLLHGDESAVCTDADYTGVEKRPEHEGRKGIRQVAARCSTHKKLDKRSVLYKAKRKIDRAKNTAQFMTLFALSNLWMARSHLLSNAGRNASVM